MAEEELNELTARLAAVLESRTMMLATAESCTGGWVAKVCTDRPGSSKWFERGFVTYTNVAKQEMLGVNAATLESFGAVSEETVREMAEGALANSRAQVSVAISGVAGPGGGSPDKPVGTVWIAWALKGGLGTLTRNFLFSGDREAVREQAVIKALRGVLDVVTG